MRFLPPNSRRRSPSRRVSLRPPAPQAHQRRTSVTAVAALVVGLAGVPTADAAAQTPAAAPAATATFDIAAQPLAAALAVFARQSGLQLVYAPEVTLGKQGNAIAGVKDAGTALNELLRGTGLRARQLGSTWAIDAVPASPTTETTLPVIRVKAEAVHETATGPVQGFAARRSATATKTDTPLLEVPQSVSVIGREEMQSRGAQDVMEIVRYTPGVSVNQNGFDNRGWEDITLRGFATYTSTYHDGLPLSPLEITYPLTEPYSLERVEVLRGPSSMVFGQGDAGGIIHRVSKQPTGERLREIEVQYGSFDRKQVAFDIGDALSDRTWSYRLVGVLLDSNDQDEYPDGHALNRKRRYLAPSLRWQPSAATSLTLRAEVLQNRSPEDSYYLTDANHQITSVKMGDYSFGKLDQDQTAVGYGLESQLTDQWSLSQSFRYSHITFHRNVIWVDSVDADGHTLHRIARTWNDPQTQVALDTHLLGKFRTPGIEQTVLLGVDWNRQKGKANRHIGPAPDLDALAPVYGRAVARPDTPLADYTQTTQQIGVYAQDQLKIDKRWVVTLGGRLDRVAQRTEDRLNGPVPDQVDNAFSGRAGLSNLFQGGWAPYVSYAESFLPTAGLDAAGEAFKPSRGKQWEAGLKYQPPGSSLLATAAVYDLRKTNVVSYDPVTFEGRQIGKQRSRGVELELKGDLLPGLKGTASYTRMDIEVLKSADPDEIGKRPPGKPKQLAAVWLDYTTRLGLGFGVGVRNSSGNASNEHNTAFTPGFTLVDASMSYAQGPWHLALNISNLFDKAYVASCYFDGCYAGLKRAATFTAKYSF